MWVQGVLWIRSCSSRMYLHVHHKIAFHESLHAHHAAAYMAAPGKALHGLNEVRCQVSGYAPKFKEAGEGSVT